MVVREGCEDRVHPSTVDLSRPGAPLNTETAGIAGLFGFSMAVTDIRSVKGEPWLYMNFL